MLKRYKWPLIGLIAIIASVCGAYAFVLNYHSNFHAVVPNEFYRAGQMSPETLKHYVAEHHIRSVINLRGHNPDHGWWQQEVTAMDEIGVAHLDFRLSAKREITPTQAEDLIEVMRQAPKPTLVHCNSGADRAGLASAIYLAGVKKTDKAEAQSQFSLINYGYIPFTFSTAWPMWTGFERLSPMFNYENYAKSEPQP